MSRRLSCDAVHPDNEVIEQVAEALTDGQTVVMPTETQYALSIRASVDNALEKICHIKQRKEGLSVALFVQDIQMAERFCDISDMAKKLADRFLPGPLTLVLPGKKGQTDVAAGFLSPHGFGIRVSSSPIVKAIMGRVAFPVTATSANISGRTTPQTVPEISRLLGDLVDLYLDAGPCRAVTPSTVVKADDDVTILRHGVIPEREIRRFLEGGE